MSNSVVRRGLGFVLTAGSFAGGCSEPEAMYQSAPPGIDARALLREQTKEAEEPQAIGEQAGQASSSKKAPVANIPPSLPTAKGETKKTESGVEYETIKEGTGTVAKVGQRATVHYTGTLDDGRKFDSSRDPGKEPFTFEIGAQTVIKGWDEAIPGMRIGEIRKLKVPASAGYGALGKGTIPANAVLLFEVELMNVQ